MKGPDSTETSSPLTPSKPKRLSQQQIRQIETVLESVGEYGEVHLIVRHGELKYINRVLSQRAWGEYDEDKPDS